MLVAGTQGGSRILNQTGRSGTDIQNRVLILNLVLLSLGLSDGSIENHAAKKQKNWGLRPAAVGRWLDRSYFPVRETPRRLEIVMVFVRTCIHVFISVLMAFTFKFIDPTAVDSS